jgi:hypothetical protein
MPAPAHYTRKSPEALASSTSLVIMSVVILKGYLLAPESAMTYEIALEFLMANAAYRKKYTIS